MKKIVVMLVVMMCVCYMSMDPVMGVTEITYTVKTGDTVWSIAEQYADTQVKTFNEFVWEIGDRNKLAGKYIQPGDQLIIPLWTRAKK